MFQQPAKDSDFKKRRAFQQFNEVVTPELMIKIHEDVCVFQRHSEEFMNLINLIDTFKHESIDTETIMPMEEESEQMLFFGGAIRRRDADFMKLVGAEIFEPHSQINNPFFQRKLREIATGTAPRALHAV